MAGFFSLRIAPGVRLSASSRGLRAHLGPRGARLHVGGGRTGLSTGTGPFTWYEPITGTSTRPARGATTREWSAPGPRAGGRRPSSPAAVAKAAQAADLRHRIEQLTTLHRVTFPAAAPRRAEPLELPEPADVVKRTRSEFLRGIGMFHLAARRAAKARAEVEGRRRYDHLVAQARQAHDDEQRRLDDHWRRLCANDPDAVLTELAARFADNQAPAAAVSLVGAEVHLAVLVPGADVVPERSPAVTAAGNLALQTMTKTRQAAIYRDVVAGHLLATVNEAFAAAPAVTAAAAVAVRDEGPDVYGAGRARPLLAARFTRNSLTGVQWQRVEAWDVVVQAGADLRFHTAGRTRRLDPLDLTDEPDLHRLATAVDWDDLDDERPGGAARTPPRGMPCPD